jgi:iron-sulfur cluster insertion protein
MSNAYHAAPENNDPLPVTFTPAAAHRVQDPIREEANPDLKLRVFVAGGGCSGFQYGFAFEETAAEDDAIVGVGGFDVLIDGMSYSYLCGAKVDFVDDLEGARFIIDNPNATSTCGCGSSFTV